MNIELKSNDSEKRKFSGSVRPLQESDLLALEDILKQWLVWSDTGNVDQEELDQDMTNLRGSLEGQNNKQYFVALDGSRVIGVIGYTKPKPELLPFAKTGKPGELINFYVHKDYRRGQRIGNVGRALDHKIEEVARSYHCTEIILDSGPRHKESGHPYYDKNGYERAGIIPNYYGPGGDTTVFRREI